jgi:arylsulfatase A-like enzyme
VIVILTDDQGWGDLSLHGNTNLATPHVDALARDGARFDRFYVCPLCSPTRAEFLTGRYHPRCGVRGVTQGGERLDFDEMTIADTFKAAGYATAAFGKWHNGTQYPYHPNGRGFDEFYGFTSGHWGDYFSPPLDHNGKIVRGSGYMTGDFTDKAIQFIEQHRGGPFFVYLAYNTPHSPMQVPERWWNKFKDKQIALRGTRPDREIIDHTRAALAMCENIDWNVGRILARIDELEIDEQTIVVYFCDNGPNGDRWNGGMKGIKGSTDEGGLRSPLFVRWPGKIPKRMRIARPAAAIDLLPTLARLAEVPIVGNKPLDGANLAPLLVTNGSANMPAALRDRVIFSHWNNRISATTGSFRLDQRGRLYDVVADPGQRLDLSGKHPKVISRLSAAVEAWRKDVLSSSSLDDRPFPIGHANFPTTQLPARDGAAYGNVQHSSRHPNSSYFTDWTSTDDRITWDVEVVESGTFDVEVFYTCPEADIGSTIELSLNSSRVVADVVEAHDPPLRGAEHDRTMRQESYVKDFRPMKLGTIRLEKGRGKLTLRAVSIPGSRVIDVSLLRLTRLQQ